MAHPECTYLTVSGNRWFNVEKFGEAALERMEQREDAVEFFMTIANAKCEHICIENPVGIMSTRWRKPDQIIQPWQFGHGEVKKTCLWLKNLPPLESTDVVEGREQRILNIPQRKDRKTIRSRTYPGIAKAIATQWGPLLDHRETG